MQISQQYQEQNYLTGEDNSADELKLFRIGNQSEKGKEGLVTLSGYVYDNVTGDPLPGATVFIDRLKVGAVSGYDGLYRLSIPRGQYIIEYRVVGMHNARRNVQLYSSGSLDVTLFEKTNQLNEVMIIAKRSTNILNKGMGMTKIDVKNMRKIPLGLGEADLVKSTLLLPGIQTAGEASAGYNVRGGTVDQNLFLVDNAPIINANHFFGFFSTVNTDIVEDITLYKGAVPAKFGGRIASVMDVGYKKPGHDKIKVSGGISPVMGRVVLETPLVRNKSAMILSGRTTYSDWILKGLPDKRLQQSTASFSDYQGMVDLVAGKDDYLTLSGYYSNDIFKYHTEASFDYSNLAGTLKWKHTYNPKLASVVSLVVSQYDYEMGIGRDTLSKGNLFYKLGQKILKGEFSFVPNETHKIDFGNESTLFHLNSGSIEPATQWSSIVPRDIGTEQGADVSFYVSDEMKVNELLSLTAGLRFSLFSYWGPGDVYTYNPGVPKSESEISDTTTYGPGNYIGTYPSLDYRMSARYILGSGTSLKAGVHRMTQFIHMVSNTTSMSPTDIWVLSDNYIKPRYSDQFSLGIYKTLENMKMEVSVETYYKRLTNVIDYKGGAELIMNNHLETDILTGKGKAYGVELLLEKNSGALTGMMSYTYARVFHKVDGDSYEEKINNGEYFRADTDKPHDFKFFSNYKVTRRLNVTANFTYNTGRPITYPIGFYYLQNSYRILYSKRNEYRLPDFVRLDLAATINGNLRLKKVNHSSFTFSVYNVLGRRNPYSIYFRTEDGKVEGYKMSIFGQPIFTVSYNFRIFGNALGDF